jgi:hypothetical protein
MKTTTLSWKMVGSEQATAADPCLQHNMPSLISMGRPVSKEMRRALVLKFARVSSFRPER